MAYCNWLYNMHNIIGYTGAINDRPTVYFRMGRAYGRITQNHKLPYNIGREKYKIHVAYRMENRRLEDDKIHLIEWEATRPIHVSRNAFVPRSRFRPGELLTLSVALYRFPDLKLCYTVSHEQARAKARVQNELLAQFDAVRNHRLQLFYTGVDKNPAATRVIDRVV